MLEEFENDGFTLEAHQMFFVHTKQEEFKNATVTRSFKIFSGKSHDYHDVKSSVFKIFSIHRKRKTAFSNSSVLKSVFDEHCFRDGLVWTVGANRNFNFPPWRGVDDV